MAAIRVSLNDEYVVVNLGGNLNNGDYNCCCYLALIGSFYPHLIDTAELSQRAIALKAQIGARDARFAAMGVQAEHDVVWAFSDIYKVHVQILMISQITENVYVQTPLVFNNEDAIADINYGTKYAGSRSITIGCMPGHYVAILLKSGATARPEFKEAIDALGDYAPVPNCGLEQEHNRVPISDAVQDFSEQVLVYKQFEIMQTIRQYVETTY